ncbi:MAG: hypothetical protein JST54_34580 [Deltaproteobacteria bacterium]|nr:hypothetical protein [Deltaproteobacteria bacterium]
MTRNDEQKLTQSEQLLLHAALLGQEPEVLGWLQQLRADDAAYRAAIPVLDQARTHRATRRREFNRSCRKLERSLVDLGWALSRARLGRVRAPFKYVGGASLADLRSSTYEGEVALIRDGLSRLEAQLPPPNVRLPIDACRLACADREARLNALREADSAVSAAQKTLTAARKSWRRTLRGLRKACGDVGYWSEPRPVAARLFEFAERMGRWVVETRRIEALNEVRVELHLELLPVEQRPELGIPGALTAKPAPPVVSEPEDEPHLRTLH